MENARQGLYKIIYVAPERLESPAFRSFAARTPLSLLAVDEAHCVSQWGQDFRPDYLKIAAFVEALPARPPVGAFTATATARVRADILRLLGLRDPAVTVTSFDRPNLYFEVLRPKKRMEALWAILNAHAGESGVVYCATRKQVESVCAQLQARGVPAARYHAGLSDQERRQSQEDFQFDRVRVLAATNAFGMGIDKSNIRYVVHYNMPRSMESYYQEAGRAGRDGEAAECVLLYSGQDVATAKYLIRQGEGNPELTPQQRAQVQRLEMERLEQMIDYATGGGCLRRKILSYFGESAPERCDGCSACLGKRYAQGEAAAPAKGAARSPRAAHGEGEEALFEALRACRARLAARHKVPAYIVLPDSALRDMIRLRPGSLNEMLQVKGMGVVKASQYGDAFLEVLRGWPRGSPAPAPVPGAADPASPPWTPEEDERLRRGCLAGVTLRQLCILHQRQESDVQGRMHLLGLSL